jgi:hypothetical protein
MLSVAGCGLRFALAGSSMKVGITTFHYACNYGAVLQAYALQIAVEQIGAIAEVVDYWPNGARVPSIRNCWSLRRRMLFQKPANEAIRLRHAPGLCRQFERYRAARLNLSQRCRTTEEYGSVASRYDALVAGSDQIWHLDRPAPYFLEWGNAYSGLRISYAPCCGFPEQSLEGKAEIGKWIGQFDSLSVRDEFSYDIVATLAGKGAEVVADPTLLVDLPREQAVSPVLDGRYIFMYILGPVIDPWHASILAAIKQRVGDLPVVAVIPSATFPRPCPWADVVLYEAGPEQWLTLLAGAEFVYTDSFHGVLFSLKHERRFLACYADHARAPRLLDLSKRYALSRSIAGTEEEAVMLLAGALHDSNTTAKLIEAHVASSWKYLRAALAR